MRAPRGEARSQLQLQTLQDQVAGKIRERIIVGDYVRGQRLKQMELAAEFGVSVTPVREAFRILEAEGYVVGASHKGATVPSLDLEQSREIADLRLTLESDLIRHACRTVSAEVLAEARRIHDQCEAAVERGDRLLVRRLNYHFHFIFYEAADRPQTLQFVRVLWAKYPFHALDAINLRQSRMQHEHSEFLECLEAGDAAGAVASMQRHIRQGWAEFSGSAA